MNTTAMPKIEGLIAEAAARGASDLHLLPGEAPAVRIADKLERMEAPPVSAEEIRELAASVFGADKLAKIGPEVGEIHRSMPLSEDIYGRVSVAKSHGEFNVVIRLLQFSIPSIEAIQLPDAMLEAAASRSGLVIFSGETGSGKTTTMISVLEHMNATRPISIATVEDPLAYRIKPKMALVQQREVGTDVPDMLSGIAAAMHQDPDIIMVGELRSMEDLQAVISAAEVGHLVITQMHSKTPEAAIRKVVDVLPEDIRNVTRRAFAGVLRGVSAQRLFPRADKPGRVPIYGVIIPDDEMREAIGEGRDFMARRKPMPEGCRSLADDVRRLLTEGLISQETADKALGEIHG